MVSMTYLASLAALGLLASNIHAGEISDIAATYSGGSIPISGSGTYYYNLATSEATGSGMEKSFHSRFSFYSSYTAGGGVAQIFRRNTDYQISFRVHDPAGAGFKVRIHRRIAGTSALEWTGTSGSSSTGAVGYGTGLVYVNDVLKSDLRIASLVSREARENTTTPVEMTHVLEKTLELAGYTGTQTFVIREHEAAAQITNTFQNNNRGYSKLFFGAAPNLNGYDLSTNGDGDTYTITVIFNPYCTINRTAPDKAEISFLGVLQEADGNFQWSDVNPQPTSPFQLTFGQSKRFFRTRSID